MFAIWGKLSDKGDMPITVTYAEVDAAVVLPTDDLGAAIVKHDVILPQIVAAVMGYMIAADGTLTAAFAADVNGINCTPFLP